MKHTLHQQQGVLAQARLQASTDEMRHQEKVNESYHKINTLQLENEALNDDQIIEQMRKISQNSASLVNVHFKDAQKLVGFYRTPEGWRPRTIQQHRAMIQSFIADLIQRMIFLPYHFGLPDEPWSECMAAAIEGSVRKTCKQRVPSVTTPTDQQSGPENLSRNWRVGTHVAIDSEGGIRSRQDEDCSSIVEWIEGQYGQYSSNENAQGRRAASLGRSSAEMC